MNIIRHLLYISYGFFTALALDLYVSDWRWWVLTLIITGIDFTVYFSKKH